MILEYHRPKNIEDAIHLLTRKAPVTIALAGGSSISQQDEDIAVVDLQSLGLNSINIKGGSVELGAMVTLQQILLLEDAPTILVEVIQKSATVNQRNQITIGGTIAANNTFSPILSALLALDVKLTWLPGPSEINLGEWLPLKTVQKPGLLLENIIVPLQVTSAVEMISRTPGDFPQLIVCGCRWPSERLRLTVMVKNRPPILLCDGKDNFGLEQSFVNIDTQGTQLSEEFMSHVVGKLIERVVNKLTL